MKNLKKVLALVLAVSVLMGLATMASAKVAADYTDAASVKEDRTEAVDVLSSLGVFQGSSGSFNPDAILTRAEAAKIICYMTMDKEDADKLIAGVAPYLDVPATHWAAGPIAHCKTQGIIAGVGNGNFDPMGQLTGLQFAKMLLTALGYDAKREGLVGSEWGNRTAAIAISDAGITGGVTSAALAAPLSRQDACQLAFNTLEATMVKYADKGGTISSGGITLELPGATAEPLKVGKSTQFGDYTGQGKTGEEDTVEFCEYYFGDLTKNSETNDLGLETHEWHYKGDKIGAYDEDLDKTVVVTDDRKSDDTNEKKVGDILSDKSYMNYSSSKLKDKDDNPSYKLWVNGVEIETNKADVPVYRGDVVYAQTNSNKVVTTVSVARYQLAKIDEVTTSLTTTEKEKGAEYRIRLTNLDGTTIMNNRYFDDHDDNGATLAGFDVNTYTEGTVLAVAVNNQGASGSTWKIVDSYIANVVSGKPSGVKNEEDGYIRLNGQSYNFADTMSYASDVNTPLKEGTLVTRRGAFDAGMTLTDKYDFDTEYKVYLTKENYALGIEGTTAANLDDVRYVTGIHAVESSFGGLDWYAQAITMDGKIEDLKLEKGTVMAIEDRLMHLPEGNANKINTAYSSETSATQALKQLQPEPAGFYVVNDSYYSENDKAFLNINKKQESNNGAMSMIWINTGKDSDLPANQNGYAEAKEYDPFGAKTDNLNGEMKYGDSRFKADRTYYVDSETKYLTVDSDGATGGLSVKAGTGSASAKNGTKVYTLFDTDERSEPLVVVFIKNDADNTEGNLGSSNLVYLTGSLNEKVSSSNFLMEAYFMNDEDGQSKMTKTEIVCDETERGFYTYTYSNDNGTRVYDLSRIDGLSTGAVTPDSNSNSDDPVYGSTYVEKVCDGEDGGTLNATIFAVDKQSRLTGVGMVDGKDNYNGLTKDKLFLIDGQNASDATVIWVGDDEVKGDDNAWFGRYFPLDNIAEDEPHYYDPEAQIQNPADMQSCITGNGNSEDRVNKILADIYMEDDEILFIAVLGFSALS